MKRLTLSLIGLGISLFGYSQYTSCAAAAAGVNMADGSCITGQTNTVDAAGANCGGGFNGSNPSTFFPFTAGTCPEFDITFNADEEVQFILWTSGCALVTGGIECSETAANVPIVESFPSGATPTVTNGTDYILQVMTKTNSQYDICFDASVAEEADNECSGASGLSPAGATFENGGNCSYTGSFNDATTSDPAANLLCAGSLENTQWINFQPTAGATSFQIIGSNIDCAGPVCGWQFGILSGTCASLTGEGCVSDGDFCTNGPDGSNALVGSTADGFALTWSGISATGFTGTFTETGGTPFDGTENFYLVMDGNANSDCQYTLTGVNIQPLPIDLISFQAFKYSNANRLVWVVATELNNDYFTLERSENGVDWTTVKIVDGAGSTDDQTKYSVLDVSYKPVVNYYRLKQTDFDGKFEYSRIIAVDNSNDTKPYVVRSVNMMGQDVNDDFDGVVIDIYSDGSSKKRKKAN